MKRFMLRSLLIGSCLVFGFACGGSSKKASSAVSDANDAVDNAALETKSDAAFASSDWKDQTPGEVNSTNATTVAGSVYGSVGTVVAQANQASAKKNDKTTTVNQTMSGTVGGTAKVTGSYDMTTGSSAGYPINYSYDYKIVFNNYKDASVAINGDITYKGSMKMTDSSHSVFDISIKGGYSVLYQSVAYNIVTDIAVTVTMTGQSSISVAYTYTVNGQTYTGTN